MAKVHLVYDKRSNKKELTAKVNIVFDKDSEAQDIKDALNGSTLKYQVQDFKNWLFNMIDEADISPPKRAVMEEVWKEFQSHVEFELLE